jgi:hypothetical protein
LIFEGFVLFRYSFYSDKRIKSHIVAQKHGLIIPLVQLTEFATAKLQVHSPCGWCDCNFDGVHVPDPSNLDLKLLICFTSIIYIVFD